MSVNIENINKTIARIRENQNFAFDMARWGTEGVVKTDEGNHTCGTCACLAGFATIACRPDTVEVKGSWNGENDIISSNYYPKMEAKDLFGLNYTESSDLFVPPNAVRLSRLDPKTNRYIDGPDYYKATAEEGIKVLEHLRDTGKVDWTVSGIKAEYQRWYELAA